MMHTMKQTILVLSCEHAVNHIPEAYQYLFNGQEALLNTHHGMDIGAMTIADRLHDAFLCDYVKTSVSRLLIDCNRALTHPRCFSDMSSRLPKEEKQYLVDTYYRPFRESLTGCIASHIAEGYQVFHLSVHSFTPELNGITRNTAIGLLYDPSRHAEKEVARIWRALLLLQSPRYRIRMNYPYRGNNDGLTHSLRKKYNQREYVGLELECNQSILDDETNCELLINELLASLQELMIVL